MQILILWNVLTEVFNNENKEICELGTFLIINWIFIMYKAIMQKIIEIIIDLE